MLYGGSCAVRMSNAFIRAGYQNVLDDAYKNTPYTTVGDGTGKRYIIGAHNFALHVGVANPALRIKNIDAIEGKTGIIYFENFHVDLYDGTFLVGNSGALDENPQYKLKPIYFKELKKCECDVAQ